MSPEAAPRTAAGREMWHWRWEDWGVPVKDAHDAVLAIEAEAAAGTALDVERLRLAYVASVPPNKHGQLCPVWTKREKFGLEAECDCFVRDRSLHRVTRMLDAYARLAGVDSGTDELSRSDAKVGP